ncbi:hypothetical protein H5410_054478 [Solanum commersonii]|uniref:Auxin-induced SAUR n=1 Tax=Solanum commersonii TaxID=4109 RepID=A0A9J5WHA4_SOLCO|nr:hypothetical protein H5410_054478 [Solanum commersonii]
MAMMISTKKLIKMARKWQKFAAMQRKRISFPRNVSDADSCSTSSSSTVEKGHFVVYTPDQAALPFHWQLLNMSKKNLGCRVVALLHYLVIQPSWTTSFLLIRKGVTAGDLHKALLLSIPSCCCSTSSLNQESGNQQLLVC